MAKEINESALLAAVACAGEMPPTSDQVKSWRRAGIIPRPRIEHASGVRGSRAWYPAWAAEQLAAVVRIHRSVHRLGDLCTAVWWEGHWTDPEAVRRALIVPLERVSDEACAARGGEEDPYEAADVMLATMRDDQVPSPAVALLRKRLNGRSDFMDLLWTFLVLAVGGQAPWEQEDRSRPDPAPGALRLLATATGVDRAVSDRPMGQGSWLPAEFDLPTFIAELRNAGGFDIEDVACPIREASDSELAQAREDALLFSQPLAMIGSVLEGLLGEDIAGFGSLSVLTPTTSFDRAAMVRNMLILRELAGQEAFSAIRLLVEQVQVRFAAIAELRAALPQHQTILRLDYAERLVSLPAAEAEQAREDVARFLQEYPQVASALEGKETTRDVNPASRGCPVGHRS